VLESGDEIDSELRRAAVETTAAVVMGRRLLDFVDRLYGRNDEMGHGAGHAGTADLPSSNTPSPEKVRPGLRFRALLRTTSSVKGKCAARQNAGAVAGLKLPLARNCWPWLSTDQFPGGWGVLIARDEWSKR
jgi:hypothetical protein